MRIKIIIIILCFIVTGCGTFNAKGYSNNYIEPTKGNSVDFYYYVGGNDDSSNKIKKLIADNGGVIDEHCPSVKTTSPQGDAVAPALIPLIATFGKYIFNRHQDKKLGELDALKKASKSTYAGKAFLSAIKLKNVRCVILVRNHTPKSEKQSNSESEKKIGLIVIAKLSHLPENGKEAFSIKPTYIKAHNSSAKTKKAGKGKNGKANHPKINLAIGFAIKMISHERNTGLPKLGLVGAGAVSVGNVELTVAEGESITEGKNPCEKKCPFSDLIPHLDGEQLVSISMSVTESGQVGFNFDQRKAEITAIKEAFGTAISESLKEKLSDD